VPTDVFEWMVRAVETRGVKKEFFREMSVRKRGL
jgi:hypothetical protein